MLGGHRIGWSARLVLAAAGASAIALGLAACGGGDDERTSVVVTTPVLGALVRDVVGDAAQVEVVLPEGADPHDHQPSARDAAALGHAAVIVANGGGLEQGLEGTLEAARGDGVPVFVATEHAALTRGPGGGRGADPHIFLDPALMADVVLALGPALAAEGIDVGRRAERVAADLRRLDVEVAMAVAAVPAARRRLVTGHESLGYYAERYGFEVVGAVVPNLSTTAGVSAADVAEAAEVIDEEGVRVIFTEPDTAPGVARAIAQEADVEVVTAHTDSLGPGATTYCDFLTQLTHAIVVGLGDD